MTSTTCCIAGGGPAGAMLGLLLARSGIDVIVLEKHGDFLRDFRGDSIHPSTLDLLDELGLGPRFERLEHRKITSLTVITDEGEVTLADFGALRGRHPYVAMVPQWDFLNMITDEAARHPNFRLLMNAEAVALVRENGRVTGIVWRDRQGAEHRIDALLTVAADGRHSTLRRASGLRTVEFGAPMDVLWFRVRRNEETDRDDAFLRLSAGHLMAALNRTTYWQFAYIVPKGDLDALRSAGIGALRRRVADLVPFLADRTGEIDFDSAGVLDVRVDRLRRWYLPGFLCIGDAAHAMSPIGGVGINLAIQDAVATANLLYEPLRRGVVRPEDLAAVQRRRCWPTAAVQAFQRVVQRLVVRPILNGRSPVPVRLLARRGRRGRGRLRAPGPARRLVARMGGYGPRPEHLRIPAVASSSELNPE